jgi:hypothetical protein
MLEFGTTAPLQELKVNSGGVLSVVERYGATYGTHQWKRITRVRGPAVGQEHWQIEVASMVVASGGTFNWAGGSMAATALWNQGTTTVDSGVLNGQPFNRSGVVQDTSFLVDSGTLTINAMVVGRGMTLLTRAGVGRTYTNISGTPGRYEGEGSTSLGGTQTGEYVLVNLPDAALGFSSTSTRQSRIALVNTVRGSSIQQTLVFNELTNFPNGRIEFRKRITFQYRTAALAAIENVHVFIRDTNNGLRSNRTNDNYVNDRTYLGTSNASGLTSQLQIMTATVRPTASGDPALVYDRRSVSNDENDVFRVGSHTYTHLLSDLSIPMRGTGDLTQGVTMFADASVTLSQSAAAALTSIATLNDLYDAAKNWKCQANATRLEYPTLFTQPVTASGTALDLGSLNVVIDPSAAAAFAINTGTNTITAKATTLAVGSKFVELQTTGTISFANGGTASARLSGILTYGLPAQSRSRSAPPRCGSRRLAPTTCAARTSAAP